MQVKFQYASVSLEDKHGNHNITDALLSNVISYHSFLCALVIKDATFAAFWYKNSYFLNGTGTTVSLFNSIWEKYQECRKLLNVRIPLHNF